ncbi:phage GP46 family protein [Avibacterium paragallinarum]|uniref:phage GP46 family protein n=1 Tax=Avibacterium paragallinarum TaxID=728 RepID=UPI0021F78D34|nr:phage GP46 family protein [Avibacterium paragallinarum]UXN35511.1 phage GP46 family protein [Avibacterium paragallinarum]UXN35850.1 phage GP46 family protein [Avibacterium paragallinarum]UXN37834.1 phage GP46 family protein [Avibacterium paragallinarum]
MSDLSIMWKNGEGDLVALDDALLLDDTLTTSIIISLFTDMRVDKQRGWWGNTFGQDELGSRLWTLTRSKQLNTVLDDAQAYAEQALQWLVQDKQAIALEVIATNPNDGVLLLTVVITLPNGTTEQRTFYSTWSL